MHRLAGTLTAAALLLGACSAASEPAESPPAPVDLVTEVADPLVIAHRGGPLVYPEHSMAGYRAAAAAGFAAEPDIQFLVDGTPVSIHDATVDRTMTGATGPVADLTVEQWQTARINPAPGGGPDATPVTFAQVLDEIGGQTLLVPEVKPGATPAQVQTVIDMVTDRDLDDAVLMQSTDYAAVEQMEDAGLQTMYLLDTELPPEPLEELRADGVDWIGANRAMPTDLVDELDAAGFRVVAYTIRTSQQLTDLDPGFSGFFSDDPWSQTQP